jgi:hypothetical protein
MQHHKIGPALLLFGLACLAGAGEPAQMSLLPPACAHLNGEALDKCVRDITVTQIAPKLEAVEAPPPDPAQLANCTRVLNADQDFCIWRNELILACRNTAKYPNFAACFSQFIPNLKTPVTANCAREKAELRAACAARNAVFAKCLEQPLAYFLCVANQGRLPGSAVKQ